jgi:bifunctional NMN adenylyltransferase/nudix hydrolase
MSNSKYDAIVYIGRMQPPTHAHVYNVKTALEMTNNLIVLFGSSFQPRTIKNPWKWYERAGMLLNQLPSEYSSSISCHGIRDYRIDQEWVQQIQRIVKKETFGIDNPKIGIIGCKKDSTSYYIDYFPQWDFINTDRIIDIDATTVRDELFSGSLFNWKDKPLIDTRLQEDLRSWTKSEDYKNLVDEYNHIQDYKKSWETAPYAPTFVTTDAAVIQSGHILLVQRKANPGKGLWALPGGFVNQDEYLIDGVIRELREETKIKVPEPVLRGSIKGNNVFDKPSRSLRGRTITHAYAFELPSGPLSKVKGSDDARHAKWVPIDDVLDMEEYLFEDHDSIIRWAISLCK